MDMARPNGDNNRVFAFNLFHDLGHIDKNKFEGF